jgi:hypothetical protein
MDRKKMELRLSGQQEAEHLTASVGMCPNDARAYGYVRRR